MPANSDSALLGYFGHHKCATTWFQVICGEVCRELGLRYRIVHRANHVGGDLKGFVDRNHLHFIAYNNADYRQVESLGEVRGFHVVRDPRDICVSAYFSHKYSHEVDRWPAMQQHRERLKHVSEEEGLLLEIDWLQEHFDEMRSWSGSSKDILELKMEQLMAAPYEQMLKVFEFLGLVDEEDYTARKRAVYFLTKCFRKIKYISNNRLALPFSPGKLPAERLLGIVWEHGFSRKTRGREPGQEDIHSHYRKGVTGDWINHFTAAHVAYFKERCNDLLLRYGYETRQDW